MNVLRIQLFGKPYVYADDQKILSLPAKVQELFFFLLLNRRYPHDRDRLAEQLWGDADPIRSRKYLRQTLWQLQTAITEVTPIPVVVLDKNWVHINLNLNILLDVQEIEQAFRVVCDVPGQELSSEQVQMTQRAVDLYQGDLLTGWYQDWCIIERERFQSMCLVLLEKVMDACIALRQYENGVTYGMRVLQYDRARERTHRRLMRLYYLAGNRSAALRQFDLCAAALAEELDVSPSQRTLALRDQIRADQLVTTNHPASYLASAPETTPLPTSQVVTELRVLQTHLANLQQEVKTLIQRLSVSP